MKLVKQAVLSAIVSLGVFEAQADQTNVVQNLGVHLRGVQSGGLVTDRPTLTRGLSPAKIENRDVIAALGLVTSNAFSRSSRLVIVTPLGGGESAIQIRDGTNRVDVTDFFRHEQVSDSVSGSVSNAVTHQTVGLDYSIQRITLHDAEERPALGLHFDVRGFAAERDFERLDGISRLDIDAAGTGDVDGNFMILHGGIKVEGARLEVVPVVTSPAS